VKFYLQLISSVISLLTVDKLTVVQRKTHIGGVICLFPDENRRHDISIAVLHVRGRRCGRKILTSRDCISTWRTATKDAETGKKFHKVSRRKCYYFAYGAIERHRAIAGILACTQLQANLTIHDLSACLDRA